jgi:flavin reductase
MPDQPADRDPALEQSFRAAMRRLAATVTVLSTRDPQGRRCAMTATAVTSVSAHPPALLACVNRSAALHAHLGLGHKLCINLLHTNQQPISDICSGGAEGEARFATGDWREDADGVPYLQDSQANIFCAVEAVHAYGSHSIFIGRVLLVHCREAIAPLVYQDGRYMRTEPL